MKEKLEKKETPGILIRLQLFMKHMGLSAYQINKDAGLTKGLITNAFSKGLGLTSGTLEALLNTYPQLNANWLIVGRGEMLQDSDAEKKTNAAMASVSCAKAHIQDLQNIQDQCVELVKQIQQMKLREQANADDQLLQDLLH